MPTGNVELTAHHSNKLEVSGGTAKVNGNSNADFARPGAAVTVTAGSPEDYQLTTGRYLAAISARPKRS